METLVAAIRSRRKFHRLLPIASMGQSSMARCAASISSAVSGCLKKRTSSFIAIVSDEIRRFPKQFEPQIDLLHGTSSEAVA
jgi:hypothetical protein